MSRVLSSHALQAKAATIAILDENIDVPLHLPYPAWEEAFVDRWGLPPLNNGRYAWLYMETERMTWQSLNFHQAARAFHVNEFTFDLTNQHQVDQWIRMEEDYERVVPALPPERFDLETQTKVMKEHERFNPTDWQKTNRTLFDMGKDRDPA